MKRILKLRGYVMAALMFATAFGFTSCEDDPDVAPVVTDEKVRGPFDQKGVFILNEGNFGTPNGSVSFLSDSTGHQPLHNIFSTANGGRPLGDVIQDMVLRDTLAYIVANNSNKIEVVHAFTFKTIGVVEDLKLPRYFTALNGDKGYVTEWVAYGSNGRVSVIDLKTNTVTKTIAVGSMPEGLLIANGKLYVANSGGNTISVINTATDAVENTYEVTHGPSDLVQDKNHNIWILSAGNVVYKEDWSGIDYTKTTPGALVKFNTTTMGVETTFAVPSNQSMPKNLALSATGDKLYFNYQGKTYEHQINATQLGTTVVIDRDFYALAADPETGNIFGSDENGFAGDGTVFIYSPTGQKITEFKAGIAPNGFVFN